MKKVVLIMVVVAILLWIAQNHLGQITGQPILTEEIALSLLIDEQSLLGCGKTDEYDGKVIRCDLDLRRNWNSWRVSLTRDGLHDDSVQAERLSSWVKYQDEKWVKSGVIKSQRCFEWRDGYYYGNNFSTKPCS